MLKSLLNGKVNDPDDKMVDLRIKIPSIAVYMQKNMVEDERIKEKSEI